MAVWDRSAVQTRIYRNKRYVCRWASPTQGSITNDHRHGICRKCSRRMDWVDDHMTLAGFTAGYWRHSRYRKPRLCRAATSTLSGGGVNVLRTAEDTMVTSDKERYGARSTFAWRTSDQRIVAPTVAEWDLWKARGPAPLSVEEAAARIVARSTRVGDCLVFNGSKVKKYGQATVRAVQPNPIGAHRVVFLARYGYLPTKPFEVSHLCDNPPCVNIDHLVAETHAANMDRIPSERRGHRSRKAAQA